MVDFMAESTEQPGCGPSDLHIRCPDCDYNLTGVTENRCPWCGWSIDVSSLSHESAHVWGRRIAVALVCGFVGGAALFAEILLYRRNVRLTVLDALPVLGVFLAAAGLLLLGGVALCGRGCWPMRRGEFSRSLGWSAWFSILLGIGGATAALPLAPTPLLNQHGLQVNGIFEFVLGAFWFSLPGVMLLGMRVVAFREPVRGVSPAPDSTALAMSDHQDLRVPYLIEVFGRFRPDQIVQTYDASPAARHPEIERAIAETWEAETSLADASGKILYNGRLARFVRGVHVQDELHLTLGSTDYRALTGTHFHNTGLVQRVGAQYFADALGASITVVTSDGFLVFGRRGPRVAYHAGFLHTLGGVVDETDRTPEGAFDLFGCAFRELTEELRIERAIVTEIACVGLVRDARMHQPELMFEATLCATRRHVEVLFRGADDEEHTQLCFVPVEPGAIGPFIASAHPITPVAQAAVLLYGRERWGAVWYEQTCVALYGILPPEHRTGQIMALQKSIDK